MRGLKKRDKVRTKLERPVGILHVRRSEAVDRVTRYWPSPDLEQLVEHYWVVRWDLTEPRIAETVPIASVHMVLEAGQSRIYGVMRERFSRVLTGRGRVLGTRFRPGAFRSLVNSPISSFTDRRLPLTDVFGPRAAMLGERALRHPDDRDAIAVVERFLLSCHPSVDGDMILAGRVAARIANHRSVTRVAQLANDFGISQRGLQRLFKEYVGVSPKWVIQRYRLLDAADRVATGHIFDWADLALQLGYADQAHFIREFKKLVGRPPAEYAGSLAAPRGQRVRRRGANPTSG